MIKKSNLEQVKETYFLELVNDRPSVTYLFMGFKGGDKPDGVKNTILLRVIEALNKLNPEVKIEPWQQLEEGIYEIKYNGNNLLINIFHEKNEEKENLWELTLESDFFILEQLRTLLLVEFKSIFNHKYCLRDEVTSIISNKSYTLIHELENLLREYLLKFFVKKIGSNWWKFNSNDKLQKKSKSYSNTRSFDGLLNMEIYNIDFVDLKELVTGNFNLTKELDIIQSLDAILNAREDSSKVEEKVNRLKEKFMGNWEKFFKDHIGIVDFDTIWGELYTIRCIVAHNSLITLGDFCTLIDRYEKIKPNLEKIIQDMGTRVLSKEEKLSVSVINGNLKAIKQLSIKLTIESINTILESKQLFITMDSLQITDKKIFFSKLEEIEMELSLLGKVNQIIPQGKEDGDIAILWVEFKEVDPNMSIALKYGLNIEAFSKD